MIGLFKSIWQKPKDEQIEPEFAVPREHSPLINSAKGRHEPIPHPFEGGGQFVPPPQGEFQPEQHTDQYREQQFEPHHGAFERPHNQLPPSFQHSEGFQRSESFQPAQGFQHTDFALADVNPAHQMQIDLRHEAPREGQVHARHIHGDLSQDLPLNDPNLAGRLPHNGMMGGAQHVTPQTGWLTADKICKTYGNRQVVRDASLKVRRGESVGLLGPNGAGKTTIFYMITGLVGADQGNIHIDGYDVTSLPMYRRARLGIGYLPQEASIFRGLTVEQNIMAVLEVTQKNRDKRHEKLESLLNEFNITRLRKSPSIALSGGERRRCEIARALASDPSYILLDEPFAGIDPIAIGDIRDLVRHLTDRGIGVLITDHNVRETLEMIDRAYIIHDGKVLTEGTPTEIVSNDDVRRVYLGDMFG